jgi:hypothetical protein
MIARAALLLYVATGAAGQLLRVATYARDETRFWWSRFGVDRGFWEEGEQPDNPLDIWADVQLALDEVSEWRAGGNVSLRSWRRLHPVATSDLGTCDAIAMWGLTP